MNPSVTEKPVAHAASTSSTALFNVLLQIADDHLILGHRVSELCGHAPMLEEDLSIPNMALDLLGQARLLYSYAAEVENQGRDEDDLAYLRADREYLNCLLVEKPNADFAHTMLKQFYFASFMKLYWPEIQQAGEPRLSAIAAKASQEIAYHVRHTSQWVIRLGDGTEESARRMAEAVGILHPYTQELFEVDENRQTGIDQGWLADPANIKQPWLDAITAVFKSAALSVPDVPFGQSGGRQGMHTEDFGHLLTELQYLQRAYPGSEW